ncbi:MAG: hypothetical protein R2748_03180 [Bryobacterales bacterium]
MNVVLMPMWLLSGGLFPSKARHWTMATLMRLNPLFYGVTALRTRPAPGRRHRRPVHAFLLARDGRLCGSVTRLAVWETNRRSAESLS